MAVVLASVSSAALPVFGGPGGASMPSGLRDPRTDVARPVNNAGVSLAYATAYANGVATGTFGYRWDADGGELEQFGGLVNPTAATSVNAVNANGVAVGYTPNAGSDDRAVRYGPGSVSPVGLGTLTPSTTGHAASYASLINEAGTVGGYGSLYNGSKNLGTRAIRWDANGTVATQLGALNVTTAGVTNSRALAINENGTIVGQASKYDAAGAVNLGTRAVRWASGGTAAFELDAPLVRSDGYADAFANGVSANGTAIGYMTKWAGSNSQGRRVVRWASGGSTGVVLGTLGVDVNGSGYATVNGINPGGTATGYSTKYDANGNGLGSCAVRWVANETTATELQPFGPAAIQQNSTGLAINAGNSVVGTAVVSDGIAHATVWLGSTTAALDLNTLLSPKSPWVLSYATGISDTGFVVGTGSFDPDGFGPAQPYARAFTVLVPQAGTYGNGDATLDTKVNFDDLLLLAQHYGQANVTLDVHVGDLNLDGNVNFSDLLALAQHYGGSAGLVAPSGFAANFAADWSLAQSLVPEPTCLGASVLTVAAIKRRRR